MFFKRLIYLFFVIITLSACNGSAPVEEVAQEPPKQEEPTHYITVGVDSGKDFTFKGENSSAAYMPKLRRVIIGGEQVDPKKNITIWFKGFEAKKFTLETSNWRGNDARVTYTDGADIYFSRTGTINITEIGDVGGVISGNFDTMALAPSGEDVPLRGSFRVERKEFTATDKPQEPDKQEE